MRNDSDRNYCLEFVGAFQPGNITWCSLDFSAFQYVADRFSFLRQCVRSSHNGVLLRGHMFECFLGVDSYIRLDSFLKELHSLYTEQIKPSVSMKEMLPGC